MTDDIVARLRLRTDPSQMLMCYPPRPAPDMLCCEAADEIEGLRERRDDWRAAMTENHDLWRENERLRAALERIAQHDMQAIALDALRLNPVRTRPAKDASDDAAT